MEPDRLRPRRLPQHVVLQDPNALVPHQLRREPADPRREHLRRDHRVRLPRVAELPGAVLGISALDPVHLVGLDAGLVLALEQRQVALAEAFERAGGDQALLDDQEAVAPERRDLFVGEAFERLGGESVATSRTSGGSCPGRRTGTGRRWPGSASGGRRACRPRPASRARANCDRHARERDRSASAPANACPLVTTPICWRPTNTGSPCPAVSLPSSSSPTSVRCGWALRSSSAARPTKSSSAPQVDREPDPRLERVDLLVELVAGEDQPRLDPNHVERVQAERREPVRLAGLPDRVPDGLGVARMAPDLVAELARVAGARDHDRDALRARRPGPRGSGTTPGRRASVWAGGVHTTSLQDLAARRALDGDVVQLVGRGLDPRVQPAAAPPARAARRRRTRRRRRTGSCPAPSRNTVASSIIPPASLHSGRVRDLADRQAPRRPA